jgi:hypothetical protein
MLFRSECDYHGTTHILLGTLILSTCIISLANRSADISVIYMIYSGRWRRSLVCLKKTLVGLIICILAGSNLFRSTTRSFDGDIRTPFLNYRDRHMVSNMHPPELHPIHDEEVEVSPVRAFLVSTGNSRRARGPITTDLPVRLDMLKFHN